MKPSKLIWVVLGLLMIAVAGVIAWTVLRPQPTVSTTSGGTSAITNGIESITLVASVGHQGTAIASRSTLDSIFIHGISADLADPPAGQTYAGWLVKNGDAATAVSTGTLVKDGTGYALNFSSPTDYRSYTDVWVTLQTAASQGPKTLVLSGSFK